MSTAGDCQTAAVSMLMSQPVISIIMPCRNESRTVAECVRQALRAIEELALPGEVVVCDNGSTDGSRQMAAQAGARVVSCSCAGYGNAVRAAIGEACGEFLIMVDADGSHDLSSLLPLVKSLQAGADLVVGNRFQGGIEPGAMPWINRRVGNPGLTWLINRMFHVGIGDTQCGLRGLTRAASRQLMLRCDGMELASEMLVKAKRCGLRIVEIPTRMFHDGRNRKPHLLPVRDGWRHLKFLLMFSPLHLFLIPGATTSGIGLLLTLLPLKGAFHLGTLYMDVHWMVLGILLLLIGLQVMQFGVIARLYTVRHVFPETDRALDFLNAKFTLERGLTVGVLLFLPGVIVDIWILWEWIRPGPALMQVKLALLATTLMAIGTQTVFFSFLCAMLQHESIEPSELRRRQVA